MVYTLYLDASGDSGKYRGNNTRHFVLGGIACKPEFSLDCSKNFNKLLSKYFPDPNKRPTKIRWDTPVAEWLRSKTERLL